MTCIYIYIYMFIKHGFDYYIFVVVIVSSLNWHRLLEGNHALNRSYNHLPLARICLYVCLVRSSNSLSNIYAYKFRLTFECESIYVHVYVEHQLDVTHKYGLTRKREKEYFLLCCSLVDVNKRTDENEPERVKRHPSFKHSIWHIWRMSTTRKKFVRLYLCLIWW